MANPIDQHIIKMASLGRSFHLGDRYDYYNDKIIQDKFSTNSLTSTIDANFKLKFILSEPESNRWEQMGLDQHTKVSDVAGIINNYCGASSFLNDRNNPEQVTQVVVCRIKSKKERLDLATLINQDFPTTESKKEQQNSLNKATHVVVGIVYGAEIYCILTQDFVDKTNHNAELTHSRLTTEFYLTALADKMESALKENRDLSEFAEQFDQEERKNLIRIKCRLYVDLSTPTFRECNYLIAYKNCLELTRKLRKVNGNSKVVPILVELCPLSVIKDPTKPYIFREIAAEVIDRCCHIKVKLETIRFKAETSFKSTTIKWHRDSLRDFVTQIDKFCEFVTKSLKESVLRARNEGKDEAVEKTLQKIEEHSIFKPNRLEQWLRNKSAEVEITKEIINCNGIIFFPTSSQLQKELSDSLDRKYTLVLQVPSIEERTNKFLETMKDYFEIYTKLVAISDEESFDEDEENLPWHMIQWKRNQVLEKINEFSDYILKNRQIEKQVQFFTTQSNNGHKFGCCYSIYESDNLLKNIYHLPSPPTDLQIYVVPAVKGFSLFRLEWNYVDLGYPIRHFIIQYRTKNISHMWNLQKIVDPSYRYTTINCKPDSILEFRVAVNTYIGSSEFSDIIDTELAGFYESRFDSKNSDPLGMCKENQQKMSLTVSSQKTKTEKFFQVQEGVSDGILEPALQSPINLMVKIVTQSTAELRWVSAARNHGSKTKIKLTYRVRYCQKDQDPSSTKELNVGFRTGCVLEQLEKETSYVVHVVAVSDDGRISPPSRVINFTTHGTLRFANSILKNCHKNSNRNGLDFYTIPLTKLAESKVAERFVCGTPDKISTGKVQHKTILVVGAKGAGKTTLINGMINYIFGVEWEDMFRFQLIEEQSTDLSKINNQTSKITTYDIYHIDGFSIPYSLTVVDIPGYGDIKGLERDQEITDMIRTFFNDKNGIQELNVLGFVVQASFSHLTPTQMYIFDLILSIFGKDVQENIYFLLTFADSQKPPVLNAITEASLTFPTNCDGDPLHYKFNNSGFFCSNNNYSTGSTNPVDKFNKFCWKMNMENFKKFFTMLATMRTKSLLLTKQVLDERKKMEATIDEIRPLIKNGLAKMEMLRKMEQTREIRIGQNIVINNSLQKTRNALIESVKILLKYIKRLEEIALRPNPFSTTQYIDLIISTERQEKRQGFKERIDSLKNLRQVAVIITKSRNGESLLTLDGMDDISNHPD